MKKFLKAMLAAMLIAITAVTVCSCGVPSDPAKAKENLKKNGYAVDDTLPSCPKNLFRTEVLPTADCPVKTTSLPLTYSENSFKPSPVFAET